MPAGRLHAAGDPAEAAGPVPGAAHQARDLRDVLVLLGAAILGGAGLPRVLRDLPDGVLVGGGDHPPAGEQHGPPRGGQGQQVLHELVAGAGPVNADEDLLPEPGRDLPDRRGQHVPVVGERVRPGVAGPQQHGQALAGVRQPGAQWMKAIALLPGGSEQLSRPVDEDRLGGFLFGVFARSFDEFAVDEGRPGADQGDEVGCVDRPPAVLC